MKHLKLFENKSNYSRVIPRDLFNEAKLLKCMGWLSLKIHDNQTNDINIEIEDNDEPFDITLLDDGSLCIINYPVTINDENVIMKTTYNSKSNYPLICEIDYNEYLVFDEKGNFTDEFIEIFKA